MEEKEIFMRYVLSLALLSILTACTYSITMVHTEGSATDIVDENQTPTADVTASLPTIPSPI
jgi:hypothetical protein